MDDDDDDVVDGPSLGSGSSDLSDLPIATITKIIKEQLPDGVKCAADLAPLVQACLGGDLGRAFCLHQ